MLTTRLLQEIGISAEVDPPLLGLLERLLGDQFGRPAQTIASTLLMLLALAIWMDWSFLRLTSKTVSEADLTWMLLEATLETMHSSLLWRDLI